MSDLDFDFDPELIDKPLRLRERAIVELILLIIAVIQPIRWSKDREKMTRAIREAVKAK